MRDDQRSQMALLVSAVCLAAGIVLVAEFFWTVTAILVAVVGVAAIVVGVFGLAFASSRDAEAAEQPMQMASSEVAASEPEGEVEP